MDQGTTNLILTGSVNESKTDDRSLFIFEGMLICWLGIESWKGNRRDGRSEDQRSRQGNDTDVVKAGGSGVLRMGCGHG